MRNRFIIISFAMMIAIVSSSLTLAAKPGGQTDNQAFQWEELNVGPDGGGSAALAVFTVPSDTRLVIEYVSGNVLCATGHAVGFEVWTRAGDILARHRLPLISLGPAGGYPTNYLANQSLILNADGDTEVTVYSACAGSLGTMHASISGYLVSN